MGSFRKRATGWQYTVDIGRDPVTGKRKRKSEGGFKTQKAAEKALREYLNQLDKGIIEDKTLSVKGVLELWLDTVKTTVEPTTYCFYEDIVNRILIPNLGGYQLSNLNPVIIQKFINGFNSVVSPTTARHYYNVLNIALNYASGTLKVIQYNPCLNVKPPKPQDAKMRVLTNEEALKILNYTKDVEYKSLYVPLLLAITCGLRRGEICGLKWEDVDLETGTITIINNKAIAGGDIIITSPKSNNSKRKVYLLPKTIPVLKQWQKEQEWQIRINNAKDEGYVCTGFDGTPIKPGYLTQTLPKVLNKCGIERMRFHDLRHTHATFLLEAGVHPKIAAERLGHREIETMNRYSHVLPSMQKEAAEKLDQDINIL